jgi:hypothetical protein
VKKKKLLTLGTLAVGTMVVTTPINSIANDAAGVTPDNNDNDEPIFEGEPTVYDVPANPNFVVNKTVEGSNVTLTWDEYENADRYFVAKLYKVDSEYVPDGDPQYVTEAKFVDNIDPTQDYLYRIAPEVDGELQLDYVAVVNIPAGNQEEVPNQEQPEENQEQPNEEQPNNEENQDSSNNERPTDEENQEQPNDDQPTDEDSNEEEQPDDEEELTLTSEQIEQIDILAKEYVENIVESDLMDNLYDDFFNNLRNDSEFAKDFADFYLNELTPFIKEKTEEIDLEGDLDKQIEELENEVNAKVLDFFNKNEAFNQHFSDFLKNIESLEPQLETLEEDYHEMLADLVDEALLDEAKHEFETRANDYFYEALFNKSLEGLDILAEILDEPIDGDTEEDDDNEKPKDNDNEKSKDEDPDRVDGDSQESDGVLFPDPDVDNDNDKTQNEGTTDTNKQPSANDGNVAPKGDTTIPEDNNGSGYYDDPKGNVTDPSIPKTGDGSVQKVVSPLVASMLALVVAFILTPNRKRKNA